MHRLEPMTELPNWAKVGQEVICIHEVDLTPGFVVPTFMQVYTVREIDFVSYSFDRTIKTFIFRLKEIVNAPVMTVDGKVEVGWNVRTFAPVQKLEREVELEVYNKLSERRRQKERA